MLYINQDQVPPFPSETAVSIVEEELGAPLSDVFDRFDREPIAAASLGNLNLISNYMISVLCSQNVNKKLHMNSLHCPFAGQVHRAKLNGQDVVIKVQRPGLKDLFDIDLKNLRVCF